MASDQSMMDFILDQLQSLGPVYAKKMFGEYGVYVDGKIFALVCDNMFYLKPTAAGRAFLADQVQEAPPYPKAKPYFLIENLDDGEWLCQLVGVSLPELPLPKPKKTTKTGAL